MRLLSGQDLQAVLAGCRGSGRCSSDCRAVVWLVSVFVCLEKVSSVWWDVTAVDSVACIH